MATSSDLLNQALALHRGGQLAQAKELYEQVLASAPDHADATHLLGMVERALGNADRARLFVGQAVRLNPNHPAYHSNLGNILRDAGEYKAAKAAYQRAVQLAPGFADAFNNLAVLYLRTRKHQKAQQLLRQAIKLKPDFADAHNNLGNALLGLGQIETAIKAFRAALRITAKHQEARYNLGNAALCQNDLNAALMHFENAEKIAPKNATGLASSLRQAILRYLQSDFDGAEFAIKNARVLTVLSAETRHTKIYFEYLERLLRWWRQQPPHAQAGTSANLHVIGESHALSAHGVEVSLDGPSRSVSHWIEGCKQWHLGCPESNRFKRQFESIMAQIPRGSRVLLTIGEIDCRYDEGILLYWKKDPSKSIESLIKATAEPYMQYVGHLAKKHEHNLLIAGVPASNYPRSAIPTDDQPLLANLIRLFNQHLKATTHQHGHGFVDTYAITAGEAGYSNGVWHLDEHHLRPDAWREAIGQMANKGPMDESALRELAGKVLPA